MLKRKFADWQNILALAASHVLTLVFANVTIPGQKSLVPTRTEAQRLADEFMETVNQRNNQPQLFPGGEETLAGLGGNL